MTHQRRNFQAMMRARGYRVTRQRQLILDAICEGAGHTTVEEIFARAHAKDPGLNLATVYRNLEFLCRLRLVLAAENSGGRTVYEIAGETPHHHLVCRACGSVETVGPEAARLLFDFVAREHGFQADMDHLTLYGLCRACSQKSPPEGSNPQTEP